MSDDLEPKRLEQVLSVRLDPDLHAALKAVADQRGVSVSDLIRDTCAALTGGDLVLWPRSLAEVFVGEMRAATGHWAVGLPRLDDIVGHDRRMADGSCLTCAVLAVAKHHLAAPSG